MHEPQYLPVADVHMSAKNQRKVSQARVRQYAADMEWGSDFPPIRVLAVGDHYVVRDGRHRLMAHIANNYPLIIAIVVNSAQGDPLGA
jgi:hypothetical protein